MHSKAQGLNVLIESSVPILTYFLALYTRGVVAYRSILFLLLLALQHMHLLRVSEGAQRQPNAAHAHFGYTTYVREVRQRTWMDSTIELYFYMCFRSDQNPLVGFSVFLISRKKEAKHVRAVWFWMQKKRVAHGYDNGWNWEFLLFFLYVCTRRWFFFSALAFRLTWKWSEGVKWSCYTHEMALFGRSRIEWKVTQEWTRILVAQGDVGERWRWKNHLEDSAVVVVGMTAFMMVSLPPEAAETICCSTELLILAESV